MKVVLDSNIFVSAVVNPDGPSATIVRLCQQGSLEAIAAESILRELQDVLYRPHIAGKVHRADDWQSRFVDGIRTFAQIVEPEHTHAGAVPRDPDDDHIIEAAVAGHAEYIVTGDSDLLALRSYEGIAIVTPARFLTVIGREG